MICDCSLSSDLSLLGPFTLTLSDRPISIADTSQTQTSQFFQIADTLQTQTMIFWSGADTAHTQTAKLSKIADMSADTDKPQTTLSA